MNLLFTFSFFALHYNLFGYSITPGLPEAVALRTLIFGVQPGFFPTDEGNLGKGNERSDPLPIPYSQDFNQNNDLSTLGWTDFNVEGGQNWIITEEGSGVSATGRSAQMNGFSGGPKLNENWLISPLLFIHTEEIPILSFYSRFFFSGPRLKLLISMDYDGYSHPRKFTWKAMEDKFADSPGNFVLADDIDLSEFIGQNIHIAFLYTSGPESGAAEWRIDNIDLRIQSEQPENLILDVGPLSNMHFGIIRPGEASRAKSYNLTVTGWKEEVTISIDPPFLISANGNNFGSQIRLPALESFRGDVYIKYYPIAQGMDVGEITVSTAGEATTFGRFTGATAFRENTFDVVSWNIEWFGSSVPHQGPSDVDLQLQNVKTIIEDLDADVYAFQEITQLEKFNELIASLPAYTGFHSPAVSAGGDFEGAQKLAFLYKKATVDSVSTKVLLKGLDLNSLTDYPSTPDRFWASGRLPYLFEIKTKIAGLEKTIHLVNVHARSNGGGESAAHPRYAMRKYDVGVLKDTLDRYYGNVPLIILGDFNDDLEVTVAEPSATTVNTSKSSFIKFTSEIDNYIPVTLSLSRAGLRTFIAFGNVIDHMIITKELEENWLIGSERVVIPFDLVPNYQNTTSDHFPVKARFEWNCVGQPDFLSISLDNGNLTTTQGNFIYRWYKNGNLIATTSSGSTKMEGTGTYEVEIENRDGSGCISRSEAHWFHTDNINLPVLIFPNPASSTVRIEYSRQIGLVDVELFSMMGSRLKHIQNGTGLVEFDITGIARGNYMVVITTALGQKTIKPLIIQ